MRETAGGVKFMSQQRFSSPLCFEVQIYIVHLQGFPTVSSGISTPPFVLPSVPLFLRVSAVPRIKTSTRRKGGRGGASEFCGSVSQKHKGRPVMGRPLRDFLETYSNCTFSACQPLGPLTTLNCTAWPSFRLRNPLA